MGIITNEEKNHEVIIITTKIEKVYTKIIEIDRVVFGLCGPWSPETIDGYGIDKGYQYYVWNL